MVSKSENTQRKFEVESKEEKDIQQTCYFNTFGNVFKSENTKKKYRVESKEENDTCRNVSKSENTKKIQGGLKKV